MREIYAIIRVDDFHTPETPLQDKITVKCIVYDLDKAKQLVENLNKMNPHAHYFWQYTREYK